ncbi:hypothetical protein QBA54_38850 [Streptomyces sp. B21-108]
MRLSSAPLDPTAPVARARSRPPRDLTGCRSADRRGLAGLPRVHHGRSAPRGRSLLAVYRPTIRHYDHNFIAGSRPREARAEIRRLHHPLVGELDLRIESFHPADAHERMLLTYHAEPGSPPAEALRLLANCGTDATRAGAGMPPSRTA